MNHTTKPSVIILSYSTDRDYPDTYHILSALKKKGIEALKFNSDEYPQKNWAQIKLSNSDLDAYIVNGSTVVSRENIRGVWYRRRLWIPEDRSIVDKNERMFATSECTRFLNGFLDILHNATWVNPPMFAQRANTKPYQLFVAQNLINTAKQTIVKIPRTLMTTDPKEAKRFWKECKGKMIYKKFSPMPLGSPVQPYTTHIDKKLVNKLSLLQTAPGVLQEMLPKKVELRITVVGDRVFPCAIYSQESQDQAVRTDFRLGAGSLRHEVWKLDPIVEKFCIDLVKKLGLVYGAIDMVVTPDGAYYFLEINEMGQWLWIERRLPQLHITEALVDALVQEKPTNRE